MNSNSNALKFVFLVVMIGVTFFSRSYYRHDMPRVPRDVTRAVAVVAVAGANVQNTSDILVVAPSPVISEIIQPAEAINPSPVVTPAQAPVLEAPSTPDPSSAYYRMRFDAPPEITAHAAILADVMTGEIYFEKHPNVHWPTASLAKLMTAAVTLDFLKSGNVLTVSDQAVQAGDSRLSNVFHAGDTYTVSDLLKALLVSSANEAAETLAISYGRDQFIQAMNDHGSAWGLHDTHFYDPAGISVANQSTPRDLVALVSYLWVNYSEIFKTTRTLRTTITEQTKHLKATIVNTHALAERPDFAGGKTGYTPDASGNLISIFNYQKRPIVIIVLGTEDRFGETDILLNWFKNDFNASR